MKYRKKPIEIEAPQWHKNGDLPEDACYWVDDKSPGRFLSEGKVVRYFRRPEPEYAGASKCSDCGEVFHVHGWIDTAQGDHKVCPGDWIIPEMNGGWYPCKPDVFEATYEPIEEKVGA